MHPLWSPIWLIPLPVFYHSTPFQCNVGFKLIVLFTNADVAAFVLRPSSDRVIIMTSQSNQMLMDFVGEDNNIKALLPPLLLRRRRRRRRHHPGKPS